VHARLRNRVLCLCENDTADAAAAGCARARLEHVPNINGGARRVSDTAVVIVIVIVFVFVIVIVIVVFVIVIIVFIVVVVVDITVVVVVVTAAVVVAARLSCRSTH
jgi:hypothetical protein